MLKNKYILFIFLVLFFSCQTEKSHETLLSKWKPSTVVSLERKLASLAPQNCLKDTFNVDTLKAQIKELESQYPKSGNATGKWQHLDLASLPLAQQSFLSKYGTRLGNFNFSSCGDVPCLFNKIYGKENHVAGFVHYIWYLKFGHLLVADNKLPVQNSPNPGEYQGKKISFDKYLYSDQELYGFWRLSLMLKEPYTNLRDLKEIHRVPRGELIENVPNDTCGLAYTAGWIVLSDLCLVFGRHPDQGHFYIAVTHELDHHIDYAEGKKISKLYRSHENDYLALSGFRREESTDASNVVIRKWIPLPGVQRVTEYAGLSPQENFAETLAHFRLDGERTKPKISSEHLHFVSNGYFQDRLFDTSSFFKSWLGKSSIEVLRSTLSSVSECSEAPGLSRADYFEPEDLSISLSRPMVNCLARKAQDLSLLIKSQTLLREPESCSLLASSFERPLWDAAVKEKIIEALDFSLEALKSDAEYFDKIKLFNAFLNDSEISNNKFLQCFTNTDQKGCFDLGIKQIVEEKLGELRFNEAQRAQLANLYYSLYNFESVQKEVTDFYRILVESNQERVDESVKVFWESCKAISPNDELPPSGNSFTLRNGYMVSSIYNCLNENYLQKVQDLSHSLDFNGEQIDDEFEKNMVLREVRQVFQYKLQDLHLQESILEKQAALILVRGDHSAIRTRLLQDLTWINPAQIAPSCREAALRIINFTPIYHLKKDLFREFITSEICFNISTTPEFLRWLNASKEVFTQRIYDSLDTSILARAQRLKADCTVLYPQGNRVTEIYQSFQRNRCVKQDWSKGEEEAAFEISQNDMAFRLQLTYEKLLERAAARRAALQRRFF